jgi:hypothetical protein
VAGGVDFDLVLPYGNRAKRHDLLLVDLVAHCISLPLQPTVMR